MVWLPMVLETALNYEQSCIRADTEDDSKEKFQFKGVYI